MKSTRTPVSSGDNRSSVWCSRVDELRTAKKMKDVGGDLLQTTVYIVTYSDRDLRAQNSVPTCQDQQVIVPVIFESKFCLEVCRTNSESTLLWGDVDKLMPHLVEVSAIIARRAKGVSMSVDRSESGKYMATWDAGHGTFKWRLRARLGGLRACHHGTATSLP